MRLKWNAPVDDHGHAHGPDTHAPHGEAELEPMMVALTRDLPAMMRNQQQGAWDRDPRFQPEIRGKTLGIWGYGGIGQETARLARALGMRVFVLTHEGGINHSRRRFCVDGTAMLRVVCQIVSSPSIS